MKQAQVVGTRDLNIDYRSDHQVFSDEQKTALQYYMFLVGRQTCTLVSPKER